VRVSRPEIAIHKKVVMSENTSDQYVKRTQKDYTYSFKLQVVQEIERGELSPGIALKKYGIQSYSTILGWLRKFGNFNWEDQIPSNMPKTPEQKLLELEQKVKLLEKQKAFLEKQVEAADKKAIIFDMMIDLAEKEYKIPIRKNSSPEQSKNTDQKNKKR
jgi:transposase